MSSGCVSLIFTTAADGSITTSQAVDASGALFGFIHHVEWVDGDLADGVDAVLSCINTQSGVNRTLLTLTNANDDALYFVRELEDDNAGAALTTYAMPMIVGDLQVAITSGGDTKSGSIHVYWFK